jgi:hypothetical protein
MGQIFCPAFCFKKNKAQILHHPVTRMFLLNLFFSAAKASDVAFHANILTFGGT